MVSKKERTAAARNKKREEYKNLFKEIPAKSQKRDRARSNKKTLEKPGAHATINRRYLQTHDLNRVDTPEPEEKRAPEEPKTPAKAPKRKERSGISHVERALMGPKKKKKLQSLTDYQRERGLPIYGQMVIPEPEPELPSIPRVPRLKNPEFRQGILSLKGRSLDEAKAFVAHKKRKVHGASAGLKSYHSSVDRIEKRQALKYVKAYDKSLTRKIRK